ncbi:GDH/6PGL endoplasmic bifunctional protein isoform X1 [Panthera uncia]|uniref:GDH/6PGL endoplasmic bifunctional protein isoform X1 n=2 Tax=Panthera uncia TaxID=29064 RepID=UPI0020FFEE52|nr:GDH/6PGL endoplasmic bifunctional protein isoform X1 [Panthera uncia]
MLYLSRNLHERKSCYKLSSLQSESPLLGALHSFAEVTMHSPVPAVGGRSHGCKQRFETERGGPAIACSLIPISRLLGSESETDQAAHFTDVEERGPRRHPGCWKMLTVVMCVALLGCLQAQELRGHVSVILLGATGDLARKYLWRGLFQLYLDEAGKDYSFSFHGAALTSTKQGQAFIAKVLESLSCPEDVAPDRCSELKGQFQRLSAYRHLATREDYMALSKDIEAQVQRGGLREAGRIFYFSVPPFAYADIARNINSSCRPGPGAWLRVVLEKPFGHDHLSAQQLATELGGFFREEEMYRVDHYLGKQAVAQILPFRDQNRKALDGLWSRHHVERVEIIMKETVDAEGRTSFYEEYGVIRDVLQNHLTEVLTLVAMELPHNISSSESVLQHKLRAFRALRGLQKGSAVLGQYQAYSEQVRREQQKPDSFHSLTPTFAGVLVHMDNLRWEGVPFILMSGKALDERVGYVRILFRNQAYCVQNDEHWVADQSQCLPRQIVFYIGHGELGSPAVLVSRNLFGPSLPPESWKELGARPGLRLFGRPLSDFYAYSPVREQDAYSVLISRIFHGRKDSFVTTENLLASWGFWTPLLDSLAHEVPRLYPGGAENGHLLDFEFGGARLCFSQQQPERLVPGPGPAPMPSGFQVLKAKYRESPLISAWPEELIAKLADDIEATAVRAVRRFGAFHLALSGGSSPVPLFQQLATRHYGFPWAHTHLWLVDERCVPLWDPESNFQHLQTHLLQHIRVPYYNIHPMPVHLRQRLCAEEDQGAQTYASEISALVANSSFDLVLLGMGADGHTASLFPQSPSGLDGEQLVVLTESPSRPFQRMSLSLPLINRARKVAVLVMGRVKREITMLVSRVGHEPKKWPISGVLPSSGQLVWYMDYEAFLG